MTIVIGKSHTAALDKPESIVSTVEAEGTGVTIIIGNIIVGPPFYNAYYRIIPTATTFSIL